MYAGKKGKGGGFGSFLAGAASGAVTVLGAVLAEEEEQSSGKFKWK